MKKFKLLPAMAYRGVKQNGIVYYPYIVSCIFSVFTYFIFTSILHNNLMERLPHAAYAQMMLEMGRWLLSVILLLFLIYTGSFLQKRRQKEIGLYSLLGLEKKHIALMMFWETLGVYMVTSVIGIGLGTALGKLMFLLLLKMARLGVEAEFLFSFDAVIKTLQYFAVVFLCIYVGNLGMLGRMKTVELLTGSKKGEKEVKHIGFWSGIGLFLLASGYRLSIISKLDSMVFVYFFLAVLFVVLGTYLLFTSGSVAFLKLLKKKKSFFYRPANIVTVSGMLYRMKKNAAGLSNICIFATMLIITLTCTFSLGIGTEDVAYMNNPYDVKAQYSENSNVKELAEEKAEELSVKYGQNVARLDCYNTLRLSCGKALDSNCFEPAGEYPYADQYGVTLLTLADYNRLANQTRTLADGEVLVYSTGMPFAFDTIDFMGLTAKVGEEPEAFYPYPQAKNRMFSFTSTYVIIVRDEEQFAEFVTVWAKANGVTDLEGFLHSGVRQLGLLLDCEESEKAAFAAEWMEWCQGQEAFLKIENGIAGREEDRSMNGGLLFIGVIFGMIFFMCLLLIMYFKQVSEGYEDAGSFAIMQKVGMSDSEIKRTIHRQILLVFFLPLFGAILHTTAGMFLTNSLLATINFYDTQLLIRCCAGVTAGFTAVYLASYLVTAKTYYRIVRT